VLSLEMSAQQLVQRMLCSGKVIRRRCAPASCSSSDGIGSRAAGRLSEAKISSTTVQPHGGWRRRANSAPDEAETGLDRS